MREMTGSSALNTSWRSVTGDFLANVFLTPHINSTGFTRDNQ